VTAEQVWRFKYMRFFDRASVLTIVDWSTNIPGHSSVHWSAQSRAGTVTPQFMFTSILYCAEWTNRMPGV